MVLAPDGRIFITIKSGRVVIIEDGALRAAPLLNLESIVDNYNERGLGHIVLDPHFEHNGFFYLYFNVKGMNINRVSRFTAIGNSSTADTEIKIIELDNLAGTIHNAGDMVFGLDEKLYISSGDGADGNTAQSLTSVLGKVLRLNSDGTIPTDNPFYTTTTGKARAIYALGFRNPFSMAIQPVTGKIFICDVGGGAWEEINDVQAGQNYGWPGIEGKRTTQTLPANYKDPLYAYPHGGGLTAGCSIVGAAFYNPNANQFPSLYIDKFFFADYCNGYISYANTETGAVGVFATGVNRPLSILVSDDGTMYYLARAGIGGGSEQDNTSSSNGTLWKITYTGSGSPSISVPPQNTVVSVGENTTFSITAQGSQPLSYQWQVNEVPIQDATSSTLAVTNAALTQNGYLYRCVVANSFGNSTSNSATLIVTSNTRPEPTITWELPDGVQLYSGGQTLSFSGSATDAEDGTLPSSALSWKIDFHHNVHTHPASPSTSGESNGTYLIPSVGESSDNVWYRISLTATDLGNPALSKTVYQDIFPKKSTVTLETNPTGLELLLDGQPVTTPYQFSSVVNIKRSIEASPSILGEDQLLIFESWTGANSTQPFIEINTPEGNTTYKANYTAKPLGDGVGLMGYYFTNQTKTFTGMPQLKRLDPTINFEWSGSPGPGISADLFTARWEGDVYPIFSDTYTFHAIADDGVRLWVDNKLIINKWINQGATEWTGTIALDENKVYPIKLEFYENGGGATMKLLWSNSKFTKTVIPARQFNGPITDVEKQNSRTFSVYPTLAHSEIFIVSNQQLPSRWTIINSIGQEVQSGICETSQSVNISNLSKGLYFLKSESSFTVNRFFKN